MKITDKELLEKAAKAAGIDGVFRGFHRAYGDEWTEGIDYGGRLFWNPLTDDGDAMRLAVKLAIPFHVFYEGGSVVAYGEKTKHHPEGLDIQELFTSDPYEATRRAITRAAAAIAR